LPNKSFKRTAEKAPPPLNSTLDPQYKPSSKQKEERMKLTIRRDQSAKTGLFGGHKGMNFSLFCRVEISPEEQELINRYKVQEHVLTWREYRGDQVPGLTVQDLLQGTTAEIGDVATLLNNEEVIKSACQDFKTLLMVMASFGGEEVIEI